MSETSFHSRLAQLESAANIRAQHVKPTFHKSRNRKEKLAIALAHLERGGITGSYAYAPLFHACARVGIIMKPLHYRSWVGLTLFFMALSVFIAVFVLVASALTGVMPRPVRGMIEAGPQVFFTGCFILSVLFAGIHKLKAMQIGLPRWRDI
ncbi:MAG: DUF6404 family protein [Sulfitobacter sp.]